MGESPAHDFFMRERVGLTAVAFLAVLCPVAAASCSADPVSASGVPERAATSRVVVLGDSLAVSPKPAESFPAILQGRMVELHLSWTVTNGGVRGDTTTGGLRRMDALLGDDVSVLVVALGANDGVRGVALSTIEQNLATMIERAQARGIAVLLCGMETPPLRGLQYAFGFHDIYPRLASKYGVPLVPFLLSGVILNSEMLGEDGIHPNQAGAERMANTVWPYLKPLLK
jgi:acyl-CoA thioesterase-1